MVNIKCCLIDQIQTVLCKVMVKVKLSLCFTKHQAIERYRQSGGIAPHIFKLGGSRWG